MLLVVVGKVSLVGLWSAVLVREGTHCCRFIRVVN